VHLSRRLTTLYQLAVSLMVDLGLNWEPLKQGQTRIGFRAFPEDAAEEIKSHRTLEERRAFLGLVYLSTVFVLSTWIC